MNRILIQCPCGQVLRDTDQEQLIAQARRHAKEAHGMELTQQQALAMMRPE